MSEKKINEIKLILYLFLTIIVSMGQSIILINRVFHDNIPAILTVHLLSCLPPMFLFEMLINKSQKSKFIALLISFYSILVFTVFPTQLIEKKIVEIPLKIIGIFLPIFLIMYLHKKNHE